MPKKKTVSKPKAQLTPKLIQWPDDWITRIDQQRGDVSFSDFVREAVLDKIGREGLSEMPGWGEGRKKTTPLPPADLPPA